jgi:hypothetical protein
MNNEKKNTDFMRFWPLVLGVMTVTGVFFGMRAHMSNDAIHINEEERVLTEEQFNKLLRFTAIMENEYETIEENEDRIIIIEKNQAVHAVEYKILYNEVEGLESKHSRDVKDIEDEIKSIHD